MKKGKFIVFEGIDGSGKSTQSKLLSRKLAEKGIENHLTFEPTNNYIGSFIRQILNGEKQGDEKTIAALFVADRLDHVQNEEYGMLNFINRGISVISDRYYFSNIAYQPPFVPMDWIIYGNSLSAKLLKADITFFIDISPEEGLKRMKKTRDFLDRFENYERISSVRKNYFTAFDKLKDNENIIIIDGDRKIKEVFEDVWKHVISIIEF